jgi:hypothetical protein
LIKAYFYHPTPAFRIAERQVRQPVMHIQPVASTGAASAIALATGRFTPFGCSTIATPHIPNDFKIVKNGELCTKP